MAEPRTWTAGTAYVLNQVVEPVSTGSIYYVVTVAGTSGFAEPAWPSTVGATVTDGTVTWQAKQAVTITWQAVPLYTSGTTEPTWPTAPGGTVTDGSITWTRRVQNVEDANCPNTKEVIVMASKVFAINEDIVNYSATNNPLDWSTAQDAGFLPIGLQAQGSQVATVLGSYRGNLVVWTASTLQVWSVDPDPANMALYDSLESLGSIWVNANTAVGNDLLFLTNLGVRSVSIAAASTNLSAGDVGTPVDPLIRSLMGTDPDPLGFYVPGQGQYCLAFRQSSSTIVAVFTINGSKPFTWSTYEYPFKIEDVAILGGDLYFRAGDDIYQINESFDTDDGTIIYGELEWNFLDLGAQGVTKQMFGFDLVSEGSPEVAFGYDQLNRAVETAPYAVAPDTLTGGIIPMPLAAPSISPRVRYQGAFELQSFTVYLNDFRTAG